MSRVRVIIPNRNHDQYIDKAIKALKNQPCTVQVVNDTHGLGKGFLLNSVVPHVTEEWINIHDADDVSMPGRFQICEKYFDYYDVIYHDIYIENGQLEVVNAGKWDRERYKKKSYICASSVLVRTEIAQKVRWITNTYGQDWIWLNLIAQHTDRFKYIREPLLYYNVHTGFTKKLKLKSVRRFLLRRKISKLTNDF